MDGPFLLTVSWQLIYLHMFINKHAYVTQYLE